MKTLFVLSLLLSAQANAWEQGVPYYCPNGDIESQCIKNPKPEDISLFDMVQGQLVDRKASGEFEAKPEPRVNPEYLQRNQRIIATGSCDSLIDIRTGLDLDCGGDLDCETRSGIPMDSASVIDDDRCFE